MSPISKNLLVALAALPMAMGIASASRASEIVDPPVFASSNGLLDILMIAQPGVVTGLTFEGFAPTGWFYTVCQRPPKGNTCPNDSGTASSWGGFRLALQPGDELKIRLINNLPVMAPSTVERIHDDPLLALNPTDLHTHGLIVPASPNTTAPPALPVYGDFVLTAIFNYNGGDPAKNPAEYDRGAYNKLHAHYDVVYNSLSAADYDIHIPSYMPTGAYWIHPHMHGISGVQISAGMSGIISIGNIASYLCYDESCNHPVPESSVRHLILKDMQVLASGAPQFQQDPTFCTGSPPGNGVCAGNRKVYPGGRWFFSLNGQQYPTIPVAATQGEVWRFTNSAASATYDLQLVDDATTKPIAFQLIAVDGVAVRFPEGASAGQVQAALGGRFRIADCGKTITTYALKPICVSEIVMMPGARVEVAVAYRDASGNLVAPPPGASATLLTKGILTGPGGDPWPPVNLASVQFASGPIPDTAEPLHINAKAANAILSPSSLSGPLTTETQSAAANACKPLPTGYHRRIYFANPNVPDAADGPGTDAYGNAIFGIGYEEIDQYGQTVPGTFHDVTEFNPAQVICLPLGPLQTPVYETWEIINLATELHNFHIHQTKFAHVSEAVATSGPPTPATYATGILDDSVPLPFAIPGPGSQPILYPSATSCLVSDYKTGKCKATSVWVQIPFTQLGTFVFHCHILEHEDGGMMHAIQVVPSPS